MDSREAFETWSASSQCGFDVDFTRIGNFYKDCVTNYSWETWQHQQAIIDALEKEIAFIRGDEYLMGRWEATPKEPQDDGSVVIRCSK